MKGCRPEETPNRTLQEQRHHPRGQCRVLLCRNPKSVQSSGPPTLPDSEAQALANASHTSVTQAAHAHATPTLGQTSWSQGRRTLTQALFWSLEVLDPPAAEGWRGPSYPKASEAWARRPHAHLPGRGRGMARTCGRQEGTAPAAAGHSPGSWDRWHHLRRSREQHKLKWVPPCWRMPGWLRVLFWAGPPSTPGQRAEPGRQAHPGCLRRNWPDCGHKALAQQPTRTSSQVLSPDTHPRLSLQSSRRGPRHRAQETVMLAQELILQAEGSAQCPGLLSKA